MVSMSSINSTLVEKMVKWIASAITEIAKMVKFFRDFQPGDIVLVNVDSITTTCWPFAKIVATYPGQDGKTRVVSLKTKNRVLSHFQNYILVTSFHLSTVSSHYSFKLIVKLFLILVLILLYYLWFLCLKPSLVVGQDTSSGFTTLSERNKFRCL